MAPDPYGDRREERDLAPGGGEAEFPPWNADPVGGLWLSEPSVGRVADGIPSRLDRLKCLGNAVVPQQAFPIFQAIAAIEMGAILLNPLDRTLSVITRCDACPEPCPCRRCIGEEEARCGDICQGCRGSKFCGFMDRKKAPKKDVTTADRVEDRLDMMRRRSS